jgi:hypothetical protein
MGAVFFSIDRRLVETVQRVLHAKAFVETGTFEGESVARVADLFDEVMTVEQSPEYYRGSARRFEGRDNIHVALGDSPDFLKTIKPQVRTSALFWLDAHWCHAESSSGELSQCPLLAELEAIGSLGAGSAVMIDDARLFMAAPPKPHEITQWPTLSQVMRRLTKLSPDHSLMVLNDVIIFYPPALEDTLRAYAHEYSVDWLHILDESREYEALLKSLRGKDEAILEKEAALTTLTAELTAKDSSLLKKDIALKEKEIALLAVTAELLEKDAALKDITVKFVSSDEALKQKDDALLSLTADIRAQDISLNAKEDVLRELNVALQEKVLALAEALNKLTPLYAELSSKDASLQEKDVEMRSIYAAVHQMRGILDERGELVESQSRHIDKLTAMLARRGILQRTVYATLESFRRGLGRDHS